MKFSRTQIVVTGLVFHILAAIFSVGYHHCDELFQIFEFAGYKLGLNNANDLPWEFHEQMRSGVQPLIVYLITIVSHTAGIHNPFTIALIIRLLQGLFSFFAIVLFTKAVESQLADQKHRMFLWAFSLLFWFMPYFHVRFSSENFSATLLLYGVVFTLSNQKWFAWLFTGVLFGFAFVTRFQMCFMIAGYMLWLLMIRKAEMSKLILIFSGIVIAISLGFVADKWLYGHWTCSWYNYLDLNLFKDKAAMFGTQPFYFYIEGSFLQLIPPFSIVIIAAVVLSWIQFRTHFITWITLPFILIHFFVGHKELRFLFPVLNFLPFMIVYFFGTEGHHPKLRQLILNRTFVKLFLVINGLVLAVFTFKPADNISFSLKKIYDNVADKNPILYFEKNDPYNNAAALNYFKKPSIQTVQATDTLPAHYNSYLFSENFNGPQVLTVGGLEFKKIYANYPEWFSALNVNNWQSRSFSFSLYKSAKN